MSSISSKALEKLAVEADCNNWNSVPNNMVFSRRQVEEAVVLTQKDTDGWKKLSEHYSRVLNTEKNYNRKIDIQNARVEVFRKIEKKREWKTDCGFVISEEDWEKLKKELSRGALK